jgi:hypothetical protein
MVPRGEEFEESKGFKEFELLGNPGEQILYPGETPGHPCRRGWACYDAKRRSCTLLTGDNMGKAVQNEQEKRA